MAWESGLSRNVAAKMKAPTRIAIEVLLPSLIASLGTTVYLALVDFQRLAVSDMLPLVGAIFVVSLIPSAAFTILLELILKIKLLQERMISVAVSSLLGAFVGFGFLAIVGDSEVWTRSMPDYLFVTLLGAALGAFVVAITRRKEVHNHPPPPTSPSRGGSS